jgi:hypothetical protein
LAYFDRFRSGAWICVHRFAQHASVSAAHIAGQRAADAERLQ